LPNSRGCLLRPYCGPQQAAVGVTVRGAVFAEPGPPEPEPLAIRIERDNLTGPQVELNAAHGRVQPFEVGRGVVLARDGYRGVTHQAADDGFLDAGLVQPRGKRSPSRLHGDGVTGVLR